MTNALRFKLFNGRCRSGGLLLSPLCRLFAAYLLGLARLAPGPPLACLSGSRMASGPETCRPWPSWYEATAASISVHFAGQRPLHSLVLCICYARCGVSVREVLRFPPCWHPISTPAFRLQGLVGAWPGRGLSRSCQCIALFRELLLCFWMCC